MFGLRFELPDVRANRGELFELLKTVLDLSDLVPLILADQHFEQLHRHGQVAANCGGIKFKEDIPGKS